MCRLLVDTMVWNYVAKAHVLAEFVESLRSVPAVTPLVIGELEEAVGEWPELSDVLDAAVTGTLESIELDNAEHCLLIELRRKHGGLSETDCSLLALAVSRGWQIVTCERSLRNAARRHGAAVRELTDLVNEAVASKHMSLADKEWITYSSRGGTQRRVP